MNLELVFLGTGASIPSRERSLPCVALRHGPDITLFDCGEGTQRQLMLSPLSFMKVERIMVSHLHGDHILGIPGLLQTMSLSGRDRSLTLAGPPGLEEALGHMMEMCQASISFPLQVQTMQDGDVLEGPGFRIQALGALHVPGALSFIFRENDRPGRLDRESLLRLGVPEGPLYSRIQQGERVEWEGIVIDPDEHRGPPRPGRVVAYSGDTLPNMQLAEAARGADMIIHEATFGDDQEELAAEHGHSTASQAASVAKEARARSLALTHISSRYKNPQPLLREAGAIFPECFVAYDLLSIRLPFR